MNLPKRLAELREEKKLTQAQLAEQMNVSRQTVSRWEFGEVAPSVENLKKLSELYGVSVDDLLSDGPTPPEPQKERQDPHPAKFYRGIIALLLVIIVLLTMTIVMGYFSRKWEEEEVIPIEELREEKIVSTPESIFTFTWED